MTPEKVVKHFGSKMKASAGLGISYRTIELWLIKESIPRWSQCAIAHLTEGKLKIDRSLK